ncbi:MAG: sensor domain-containing diguanylate cyclase [Candidatus Cloacimonadales bacterium]|nr:sensor domain-containing diguanylate cyclase [Candidatus Cloacimonadales bacterium]
MDKLENYEGVFQHTIDAQVIIEPDSGKVIKVNNAVVELFNIDENQLHDKKFDEIFLEETKKLSGREFLSNAAFQDGVVIRQFKSSNGELIPVEIIFSLIPWSGKTALLASMRNIRERKAAEIKLAEAYRKLEILSRTDPLTTLSNRRALLENINHEIFRNERNKEIFSIIICDVDDYKFINDNYGHNAGDFVLKEIGNLITKSLRKQDYVGRWGGDEFLMLLPNTKFEGGRILADNIREKVATHDFQYKEDHISLSMSFGVAEFNKGLSLHDCIKNADDSLYKAKAEGKNKVF